MKRFIIFTILLSFILPFTVKAETNISKPQNTLVVRNDTNAILSWENPKESFFYKVTIFRSNIPIEEYFSYEAVSGLCDKIYEGDAETYTDTKIAVNLPYYYIIFAFDRSGGSTNAVLFKTTIEEDTKEPPSDEIKTIEEENKETAENTQPLTGTTNQQTINNIQTLADAPSKIVNNVSNNEASIVYNYNKPLNLPLSDNSRRLALFIIVKSPHDLNEQDKNAISYFIHDGTPTTIILGSGERAGVLNSYLSVFNKLPSNTLEWQDVIKIANGRWPTERNLESEEKASDEFFSAIYKREPNMNNPNDNAAITVIAYGLRPAKRNMESEKKAIEIYRSIFDKSPKEAADWDLVRAIAYSGAIR